MSERTAPREEYDDPGDERRPPRRRPARGAAGCLATLVALAVLVGIGWVGLDRGVSFLEGHLGVGAPDYPGPGTGRVLIQVKAGDSGAEIGNTLKAAGVVKSVDAFTAAFTGNPDYASEVQVGYYPMRRHMRASDAVAILTDHTKLVKSLVTIPEGSRLGQIVSAIVAHTKFKQAQLTSLLAHPAQLGLPPEAKGNPEGYLFPATYDVTPGETPAQLLRQMVAKTAAVEKSLHIAARGRALGLTPHQVITVASILQYEANRGPDYPKVARVLYNRLDQGMRLQLDSTVSYVSKREGDVWTTQAERDNPSAYNTYQHAGLPPGPIGAPGEQTINAALNPAQGDWLYFVYDFSTKTTVFTADYQTFLAAGNRSKAYCRTHASC